VECREHLFSNVTGTAVKKIANVGRDIPVPEKAEWPSLLVNRYLFDFFKNGSAKPDQFGHLIIHVRQADQFGYTSAAIPPEYTEENIVGGLAVVLGADVYVPTGLGVAAPIELAVRFLFEKRSRSYL
jgi:hypothetical protein